MNTPPEPASQGTASSLSRRPVSVDPEPLRREVHGVLHSLDHVPRSEAHQLVGFAIDEVRQVLSRVQGMIEAADVANAQVCLEAITDEYVCGWELLDDPDGWVSGFLAELAYAWETAFLVANLSPAEREEWRSKLVRWQEAASDHGLDDVFEAARMALDEGIANSSVHP